MPQLILPYPVSTNRIWRRFGNRVVKSPEARAYQDTVERLALELGEEPLRGPVKLMLSLHPPRPKRWKEGSPARCIDLSNAVKAAEDALQGIAYEDDKQIVAIEMQKGAPVDDGMLIVTWLQV